MSETPRSERHRVEDLVRDTDPTLVEHFGGPDDGDFLPIATNGLRANGIYVPINAQDVCVGKRFQPNDP